MIELAPMSEKLMTYNDALLYCQFLEYNGHRDWRMPTVEECDILEIDNIFGWCVDDDADGNEWYVTPVRDVC